MSKTFDKLSGRWSGYSPREQIMLGLMAVVIIAVAGWYGVIAPLHRLAHDTELRLADAASRLAEVDAAATMQMTGPETTRVGDLEAAVAASALETGVVLAHRQALSPNELTIWIDSIDSPAFFAWTRKLQAESGVAVGNLTALSAGDGLMQVEAVLTRARQ